MSRLASPMDIRSTCSALLLLLSILSFLPSARAELLDWKCDSGLFYAANSTYQSNVRTLLASLAANASRSSYPPVGFATAVVGASPDEVWGLGLCRGDTNGTDCRSCLAMAPEAAFNKCMGVKDASIFYDRCIVRYSFRDFLTIPDNGQVQVNEVSDQNVTADAGRFDALVVSLVTALSDWAAFNTTSRFATGVMASDRGYLATTAASVHNVNGLVQCTPDQAPGPCRSCLQGLIDEMPAVFNGSIGGQVIGTWCNLRFEVFEFYDTSPMLQLVAGQTPPPPSPPVSTGQTDAICEVFSTMFNVEVNVSAPVLHSEVVARTVGRVNGTRWREHAATVSIIVLGVAVILLSIFSVIMWRNARNKLYYEEDIDDDPSSLLFDLATLRRATNNFEEANKLGHGGFGTVYKGLLRHGQQIAVKRLNKASEQGLKELRNELLLVAKLRHNNLTKLIGVCLEGDEKLLVYEYLPNRSLDTFLFAHEIEKRLVLNWAIRYGVIYGTARGLLYLHEDSQIKIIHRDLKAANILLDADMNPKISDFGLARLFNSDKTTTITSRVVGTLGYMAPEYAVLGHLSVKTDVYSFGVLILEIITGRKTTDMSESALEEESTLLGYVWDHWDKGTPLEILDSSLDCQITESEVLKCIHLGLLCVQGNPVDRPTMLDILVMLHTDASNFPTPLKPAFTFPYGLERSNSVRSDIVSGDADGQRVADVQPMSVNGMSISEFHPR